MSAPDRAEQIVRAAFARLDAPALGVAFGVVAGALLMLATFFLVLKGAAPGQAVGPHLSLIAQFVPLYSVSYAGALVGGAAGFVAGFVFGFVLAAGWNLGHYLWLATVSRRGETSVP